MTTPIAAINPEPERLAVPCVQMNGTAFDDLLEQRYAAIDAANELGSKLAAASPNGRDYYPLEGGLEAAQKVHERRIAALRDLIAELNREVELIADQRP